MREELFGVERLEQHARSLAAAQTVTARPPRVTTLRHRLDDNARVLLAAYQASAAELEAGRRVVPAAEWLLDNYHLVEKQIREIRGDLPPNFYRQLPKLADGPFAGYPRVFGLAWAYIAHTDSHVDSGVLAGFLAAYQSVQPLTIGELWAVAITLRIVLIENLRRLADQIGAGRAARADADAFAGRLTGLVSSSALSDDIAARSPQPLSELFAAQLAKRLRDRDPQTMPALGWLEQRLAEQGSTVDAVVAHAQQRQGASNVTVRNVMTSLRLMSDIDWADLFERVSLVDATLCAGSGFAAMDFATRNLYRNAIEQLARASPCSELEIAAHALAAAQAAGPASARAQDPGYHLIAEGRPALEATVRFRPRLGLRIVRWNAGRGLAAYVGAIVLATLVLLGLAWWWLPAGAGPAAVALWLLGLAIPASEVATALVQRAAAWRFGATLLPGLELAGGVPTALRTLVAVPTLLGSEAELREQIERLEVHHLAGGGGDLLLALLTDGLDADSETLPGDAALLAVATHAIAELNLRHGPAAGGARFLLLHRRRVFNTREAVWMGWERKRGKLHELNRLLRGATDTSYLPCTVPQDVRYVLTLDADTRLPRDAALRLVGKMAHPLNRPRFDAALQRVVGGYGILQPRITPSLPVGREGSLYQRLSSSPGGIDPYAMAVSDVYQDLFGEGSYTGKGIYDIDAFEAALQGRVPDNSMLSHDLFEGIFARAGLASDVELVEEAPARYDVAARRQHRWTRGDWQLLPWLFRRHAGAQAVPALGRWKMLDNLRRALLAPSALLALTSAWTMPASAVPVGVLAVLAALAAAPLLAPLSGIWPYRPGVLLRSHAQALVADLRLALLQIAMGVACLPEQAARMLDAITRTLVRLGVTRRRLLEWTTAAQSGRKPRLDLWGFYRQTAGGTALGLATCSVALLLAPSGAPWVLPFALLWSAAPALALWASRPPAPSRQRALPAADAMALRLVARRTWRFFETFVTPADHMLPPDNFQEDPQPVLARRTSPTNIGLYLLASVAARDFGWAGLVHTVERLEATFATLRELPRFKGHFFNWYGTADLRALDPRYVSSVDSGNLAGHLIALANACDGWQVDATLADPRAGLWDAVRLARQADGATAPRAASVLDDIAAQLQGPGDVASLSPALVRLADKLAAAARGTGQQPDDAPADLLFWAQALGRLAAGHLQDRAQPMAPLALRLQALAAASRAMALDMDFAFLLDPERKLLSIGYALAEQRLDANCYDLLASEARLASLFAIAKGDAPTRHWFRLGRTATPLFGASALVSWSGSMFEYLMPSLVMRAPVGSLLEQTNRLIVQRQIAYGDLLGMPWGISESAYNARDLEFTYQYANFGVPGLGLKRGLADHRVVAPYATALAAMVDPQAACRNFARLAAMGALGRHGFYEALDFTPARLPEGARVALVRNFMAHHQGMAIVAIANVLHNGRMRDRFHREPMVQSSELLLQERMPRHVAAGRPRAEEVHASRDEAGAAAATVRRLPGLEPGRPPVTHVLSNGSYSVMLTASGAGYSRWRGLAITRWREDATRDPWGAFFYLRDVATGQAWSPCAQPMPLAGADLQAYEVVFGEDQASFTHRHGGLASTLAVLVSGESDAEVRRLSLANSGRQTREIDITSYAEAVLAAPAADEAHPAFAKLFVRTEYLPEFGALVATRRQRSPEEPPVWAAHFAVVEGESTAAPQHESDRARFLGRSRDPGTAQAILGGQPLSGTVGTVLDAVFALRHRVAVPPGGLVRVAFWTVVAPSRDELLHLIDKHHDRSAFERAATLAWTQAQVQLRHLGVHADEAADFQRLAAPLLYADRRLRAPAETLLRGAGPQSGLWPHAVSGDLPIVLLRIDDIEDLAQVRQALRAHEYWGMKQIGVDLVIVNERAASYVQDLQIAIETAVRSSQARPRLGTGLVQGSVHTLRADLLGASGRALLQAAARIELMARHGAIAQRLARLPAVRRPAPAEPLAPAPLQRMRGDEQVVRQDDAPAPAQGAEALEFFNGLGGFGDDGREYVVRLQAGQTTPAPWINVVANPGFGFHASTEGSGATWCANSRDNQLTPWSNDPVGDPPGEAFYVRDEASGVPWTPTAQPVRGTGCYEARHGHGYSRFLHTAQDITVELLQYVPLVDPVKISRLRLHNRSDRPRRLLVTAYAEWVLGTSRGASAPFIVTAVDTASRALLAHKPWGLAFPGRVAFADLCGRQTAWTADRAEFLGRNGSMAAPAALLGRAPLSGTTGAGLDPCAALQCVVELAPGASIEVVAVLGQGASLDDAQALIERYRAADLNAVLAEVQAHWRSTLGAVQVKTPDRAMDILLNGWLLYQTIACRLWARAAFYQASGAYGFRDQLQDSMALGLTQPAIARAQLLRAAGRQFVEGDVQHWWLPHSGQGVRTRISDDRVWLAYAAAHYIGVSGDTAVLDELLEFLDGPALRPGEHDAFFQPLAAGQSASLFEHCARGLDQCLELTGALGLPLIGTGDWNDGMNRVGAEGRGESVWLGWLLVRTIALFAPLADVRDATRAARWRKHAESVRAAIEREAWDGAWYRRATFDDGSWLGTDGQAECRIDAIAQAWSVLSGVADPQRAAKAMDALARHLVLPAEQLVLLLTPPFDKGPRDPGYIQGYPPGVRENGGQYSHAAMWAILAFAQQGDGNRATDLFRLVNPIHHALTPEAAALYRVEPYVVAADVYAVAPHTGRGGWSWYTGSAAWMYRAGVEGILGLRREGPTLVIDPCLHADWPMFEMRLCIEGTTFDVRVEHASRSGRGIATALLDGVATLPGAGGVRLALDGGHHGVLLTI
ncbi:cyclic beta-1,2-glucan synthetase [Pseudorhodoferax soli]|uniref:Cyclic beta-1,2-glucan synthetase n=1 Tax=Pseudorhodoferax soli TaxID=545864 RepID=A0A368Y8F8_9BURK|nr:glucoamylase family protein [Pseudorhodoferax soli]RCW74484.1 cyclic beta-1,2-glucan synthetase [Pseudorhodoferax soli]